MKRILLLGSISWLMLAVEAATAVIDSKFGKKFAAKYDDIETTDGPLGLGVNYAAIANPYQSLNYSSAYAVNLASDTLTILGPPSPPNALACPNVALNSIACSVRVGDDSDYGFVLKRLYFACATELGTDKVPEPVGCTVRLDCATAAGVQAGISHTVSAGYSGGNSFQVLETPQFADIQFYRCYLRIASATIPGGAVPYQGNATLFVDNLKYRYGRV